MINSQEFNKQVIAGKTTFAKTYLFYGQTPFLSEENAQVLIAAAKKQGFSNREIFYIDNKYKFQPIFDSLNSLGLFDSKKIIELRFDTDKPSKKIGEQIAKIAAHNSVNIVIIQAVRFVYKIQKEQWFSMVKNHAVSVISKPIYSSQLPNWINQKAKYLDVKLSADAIKFIMQFSEGNLLWTNQILIQLKYSDYQQPIRGEVIQEILADMSVFKIEDLSRSLLNKDKVALKIVQKLEHENESLVFITAILYREFNDLNNIMQSKYTFTQACKSLKIWQSKQNQYQKAVKNYSHKNITDTLRQLALLDRINKGQYYGDGWLLLNHIVTNLLFK